MYMCVGVFSRVRLCDAMDCSQPGSVYGIFPARILEWVPPHFIYGDNDTPRNSKSLILSSYVRTKIQR